jgi:hypothetical protein
MTGRPLYGIDLGRRAAELYEGGHGRDAIALRGSCAARQLCCEAVAIPLTSNASG